jgi:tol-pal system protein YbgF
MPWDKITIKEEGMIRSTRFFAVLFLFAMVLLITGCAPTGKSYRESSSESADIDQLLGVGEESTDKEINEDDVLKLLGVSDESAASSSEQAIASTENAESQLTEQSNAAVSPSQSAASGTAPARTDRVTQSLPLDSYAIRYQEALQAYRTKNYRDAIQKFETLLASDSRHSLSDNCQYWIGESYYDLQNYQQAIVAFEKVFTHPKSNKDDSAQLKLSMCYLRLNEKEKAKEEFQKLVRDYPASEYTGIARRFIGQLEGTTSAP